MEIVASLRLHNLRHLSQQSQDHRDVVGSEGPKDILLSPDLAEIETIGIDVLNAP